jgi:hypothetical protein
MLCRDVKRFVYFLLDDSLGETRKHDVDSHLRLCPDCESRLKLHERLHNFVRRRFDRLSVSAPDRLKLRLARSIRAFRAEWSR